MAATRSLLAVTIAVLVLGASPSPVPHSGAPGQAPPALDPANVTVVEKLNWTGGAGEEKAILYGDPAKPGPYAMLIRWGPGHFSKPHSHSRDRMVYVMSGTWWMSTSPHYDPAKTIPVEAGRFVVHHAGKIHWDGARDEPTELLLMGEGPVTTNWLEGSAH